MKIAMVVSSFPPDTGGMGQVVYDEALGLKKKGHEVTIFTLSYRGKTYDEASFPFKIVREKPLIPGGSAGWIPSLGKKLKDFDLVHLHYPFYGGAEWVLFSGRSYVTTYHMDAEPVGWYQKIVKYFYDRMFSGLIFKYSKKVFLVDKDHDFKYRKRIKPDKVIVLPNGINTDIFKPQPASALELGMQSLIGKFPVLFVGNLLPVKGLSVLLKALKELPASVQLLVIGEGKDEEKYKREAEKLGIADRVSWLGKISNHSELSKYYNFCEAVVIPSYSESFSLVAGEALSCGRPVLASNISGITGRVIDNENGFLFEKGSVKNLAEVLKRFIGLDQEHRREMGEKGRKLIEEQYSLDKHIDKLDELYRSL